MRDIHRAAILENTDVVDVLVQEAVGTLLVVRDEVLVTLGLEPGAEAELKMACG